MTATVMLTAIAAGDDGNNQNDDDGDDIEKKAKEIALLTDQNYGKQNHYQYLGIAHIQKYSHQYVFVFCYAPQSVPL